MHDTKIFASGDLNEDSITELLAQGAPVDLFISADAETMARGIEHKLLDAASRREFAANQVVLVVPAAGGDPKVGRPGGLGGRALSRLADGS